MRLCYVAPLWSVHTVRWMRYFAQRGHEVHVLTPSFQGMPDLPDVKVHPLPYLRTGSRALDLLVAGVLLLPMVLRFRRLLRAIKPDVVHVHSINDAALFATLAGSRPLVVTAWGHDVLIGPKRSRILRQMVQFIIRKADMITCDAEHMKEALIRLGAAPSKVHIVYFGTDVEKLRPERRVPELRERLGIQGAMGVISLRSLDPIYDVASLVKAVPPVLERCPNVKFVIAGFGPEEANLKELASSLGVAERVQFVGRLSEEEIPAYLASADIYVSTALSDGGLASSTAEAMACGLPVIITDGYDNRKWVEDGISGFIVPPRSPEAVAARIIHLVEHEEDRKRLGLKGRGVIVERNNWAEVMSRMGERYEQLVADRARLLGQR